MEGVVDVGAPHVSQRERGECPVLGIAEDLLSPEVKEDVCTYEAEKGYLSPWMKNKILPLTKHTRRKGGCAAVLSQ